ncbi:MAG: hypothetical protein RLZZ318_254 [Bacteroidota bacterium]|jgi:hypothetical protein
MIRLKANFGFDSFLQKSILIYTLFIISLDSHSQVPNWAWAKSGNGNKYDYTNCMTKDNFGNIYITGVFDSTIISFGNINLTNSGRRNIFLVKYDQNGNIIWAKSFGGNLIDDANGICSDSFGNVYLTGGFQSPSIAFGATTLTRVSSQDMFIAKFDSNGNVIWAKSAGGNNFEAGNSVTSDSKGNAVVTGWFGSASIVFGGDTLYKIAGQDIFVVKYDSKGNVKWAKSAGGIGNEMGLKVTNDSFGNFYMTGFFNSSTISFNGITLNSFGGLDAYVAKYDSIGNILWAKNIVGTGDEYGLGIVNDVSGNVLLTGYFGSSTISFAGSNLNNSGGTDVFLVKYDSNGNEIWANSIGGSGGESSTSISRDFNGDFVLTGYFSSASLSIGSVVLNNKGGKDIFVVKYDSLGTVLWAKSAGGSADDIGNCAIIDKKGNIVLSGNYNSLTITFGNFLLSNLGSMDIFVAKLSNSLSFDESRRTNQISIVPNPFMNSTLIRFSKPVDNADLLVYDIYGKIIEEKKISGDSYVFQKESSVYGVFFIHVIDQKEIFPIIKVISN